ncbi:polysaccharide pyruvyl transferase family protein [bacterium]|nr:polysaccharide pyruvyl transferase family protein [candidate division CSSED10-310 bacterium]
MNIEVTGAHFRNKGAQLMLYAVVEHFNTCFPEVRCAVEPESGSYHQRARYGLYQKINKSGGKLSVVINALMHSGYRTRYGLINNNDLDAVIDISGFVYGDTWPAAEMAKFAEKYRLLRKQHKQIILLPQAFGPFSKPESRQIFDTIAKCSDLIFARDIESYQHVVDVIGKQETISIAPDFTNIIEPVNTTLDIKERSVCIIPNTMMTRKGSDDIKQAYLPFLVNCIDYVLSKDMHPLILLHEVKYDEAILHHLPKEILSSITVMKHADPCVLKSVIGRSHIVIGSRYHGLISALSQAVPSLGTGWSHKYRLLFEDYNCSEYLVNPTDPFESIRIKLDRLIQSATRDVLIENLRKASDDQKLKTQEMWKRVHSVLGL